MTCLNLLGAFLTAASAVPITLLTVGAPASPEAESGLIIAAASLVGVGVNLLPWRA